MADATTTSVTRRPGLAKWLLRAVAAGAAAPAPPAGFARHALAPGEWLLVAADAGAGDGGLHAGYDAESEWLVVDLSSAYAVVRVAGPHARDIVAKGTAIDLHDRAFAPDASAVCRFGAFRVVLHRAHADTYDLLVSRSVVEPFAELVAEYGTEFGVVSEA